MKKKVITAMMVMTILAGVLAGCGSSKTESKNDVSVTASADTETAAEESTPDFGGLVADYEPNPNYDKYAITTYTWEDLEQTAVIMVSAMEDESKFECHFTFFDDEQLAELTYDGAAFTVVSDKTGFVTKEVPVICQELVDAGVWSAIQK